jgi:DNA-binding NtrC family response regulator
MLTRQRPGKNEATESLDDPFLSRIQLRLSQQGDALEIANDGKLPLVAPDGSLVEECTVRPGELVEIKGQLLFLCCQRPAVMAPARKAPAPHAFGLPDAYGLVGESPAAWALRDQIGFVAGRSAHVLLLGESGTGKEIAAQAIHGMSARRNKRMVSRNAATLPQGLVDAELFGNVANYPNPGMPERPGLIGEADGSTLYLDEIGELPEDLQARLLRVLDGAGEYQRLGDASRRTSKLRFIGATNRPLETLKHDLAARLRLRIALPSLDERREDVPLLAEHLFSAIAKDDPSAVEQFDREPRFSVDLMRALVARRWTAGVRELETVLWSAIGTCTGDQLDLTAQVRLELDRRASQAPTPRKLGADEVRAALERNGGVMERAWRDLGLANRFVLHRLMKKHGIKTETS